MNRASQDVNNTKTDTKCVSWFLTINNPGAEEEDVEGRLLEGGLLPQVKYFKMAIETGEGNNVRHMHIYLHLNAQQRFSAVKKCFPRANIEPPVGTPQQQIDYIGNPKYTYSEKHPDPNKRGKEKGGTCETIKEYGSTEGIRLKQKVADVNTTDARLLSAKRLIDAGKNINELYEADFPLMVKYGKQLAEYMSFKRIPTVKDLIAERREKEQEERFQKEKEAKRLLQDLPVDSPLNPVKCGDEDPPF